MSRARGELTICEEKNVTTTCNLALIKLSEPQWQHSKSCDYINIADDDTFPAHALNKSDNLLWALDYFASQLKQKQLSKVKQQQALAFYIHFYTDLHQPLHVGRAEDRGGNRRFVVAQQQAMNLHRLWDWFLIHSQQTGIQAQILRIKQQNQSLPKELDNWSVKQIVEHHLQFRDQIYLFSDNKISNQYLADHQQTVNKLLYLAARRLAKQLENLLQ